MKNPPSNYTNRQWQLDFIELKTKVKQCNETSMPKVREMSRAVSHEYHGKTQYQRYCDFINSILKNIRNGNLDYCFYIYQIAELLRFHHDDLEAEWLDTEHCFCVYLTRKKHFRKI